MKITVEISIYPVRDEYLPPIKDFIAWLNECTDVQVTTSATSTCVIGEYAHVMALLIEGMQRSYDTFGTSVFVTKFIPGYEAG